MKINIKNIIRESQSFPIEEHKEQIFEFIEEVLTKGQSDHRKLKTFYELVVNSRGWGTYNRRPDVASKTRVPFQIGFKQEHIDLYKKIFEGPNSDGVWHQVDVNSHFEKKNSKGRTLNFYITIKKDVANICKFANNFNKLYNYMKEVSDKYQFKIGYKTHSILDLLITHNDSLKIYFYDVNAKDVIVDALRKWLKDNDIEITSRSHDYGVDIKDPRDSGTMAFFDLPKHGGSFGVILARFIRDRFEEIIKNNGKKYTPEQYFQWLKQNFVGLIKQVKVDM